LPTLGPKTAVKITVHHVARRGFFVSTWIVDVDGPFETCSLFDVRHGRAALDASGRYNGKAHFALAAQVTKRVPAALPLFEAGLFAEGVAALASDVVADVAGVDVAAPLFHAGVL
jgi:hypothetical protein